MHWRPALGFHTPNALAQAAAVAVLPLPDALEPLLHKFSVVTAVYGFLLRQHIQVRCVPVNALSRVLLLFVGRHDNCTIGFQAI